MAQRLGEVDAPEGIVIVIDPGLARFWRDDGEPRSPRRNDPPEHDLQVVGADAAVAGRAYDREFDPEYLFDRREPQEAAAHFDAFASANSFDARACILDNRMTHVERAHRAVAVGEGLGVVKYNGLWAVAAAGLPKDRPLPVVATAIEDGEFAGRWLHVDIEVQAEASVARRQSVAGVMVDHGQLLVAGLSPLGRFRMWESLDGLADYVFWGADAEALAARVDAPAFDDESWGWRDVPVDAIGERARTVQARIDEKRLRVAVDFRPHCNLERLNAALRSSEHDAARIDLEGASVVGFGNRWGDGVFEVSRHLDASGAVVRVRIELGTPKRQKLMRQVRLRSLGAIVSAKIHADGEPVRFAERMRPHNDGDSGWAFFAGTEDEAFMSDASNFRVERLGEVVDRCTPLAEIIDAPVGTAFRREGERFVED